MSDKTTGMILLIGSIVGIIVYAYGLWFFAIPVLQITAFIAVATLLGLIGWIGYSIATASSPPPLPETNEDLSNIDDKSEGKEVDKDES